MTDDLIIRPYTPADEDAAVLVWARAGRQAHPFIPGEGTGERERKMREVYLVHADNWMAEIDGRAVGVLGLLHSGTAVPDVSDVPHGSEAAAGAETGTDTGPDTGAEIGGLFVAPEAQGHGVGRALVGHAAARHGALTLEVYERNTAARGFYARMGFTEQSRRGDEEYDEVLLRLVRPAP
ncbi:GNAT family N-acetyltransferase [Kitasatospora sp. NPDC057015]|uniref:GNAT family N-acetyltransferase n=1 Tax=Kitasatospora sp. NPDC057015 TaxID=3346001 RepID=UPI00363FD367